MWTHWPHKDNHYPVHMRFRKTVLKIQAELEIEKLNTIHAVAQGGYELKKTKIKLRKRGDRVIEMTIEKKAPCWQAAAWFLERRYPELYGKKKLFVDDGAPDEKAAEIKAAFDAMMESVPSSP